MDDKQQIEALYREMYEAMVRKDTATLNRVHADDFVLTHMTGMHQSKQVYIQSIANCTLNYYSAEHEQMDIKVNGDRATLRGRSRVNAAVFGGGRHTWRLQLVPARQTQRTLAIYRCIGINILNETEQWNTINRPHS